MNGNDLPCRIFRAAIRGMPARSPVTMVSCFARTFHLTDGVVDFGCGGGALLKSLEAREKIGIDVNPAARRFAKSQGVRTEPDLAVLPADTADVVISHHASNTRQVAREQLRPAPYTWAPVNADNLVRRAGFDAVVRHRFSPKPQLAYRLLGKRLFHIHARLRPGLTRSGRSGGWRNAAERRNHRSGLAFNHGCSPRAQESDHS